LPEFRALSRFAFAELRAVNSSPALECERAFSSSAAFVFLAGFGTGGRGAFGRAGRGTGGFGRAGFEAGGRGGRPGLGNAVASPTRAVAKAISASRTLEG
jgi:hypothetical protein